MPSCVLVTGAAGALGSALVRHLVHTHHRVLAVSTPREQAQLTALVTELGSDQCIALPADVSSPEAWAELLQKGEKALGPVTGAALVAGGWQGGTPLYAQTDDAIWKAMKSLNADTVYASLHALLPGMVARRAGSVVVIGSRAAEQPWTSANAAAYAASKAAAVALAQAAAAEVLQSGVRINAVLPSIIDTSANRHAMPNADPNRWVSTESLSKVITFLLSEDARDISGAAIPIYGRA